MQFLVVVLQQYAKVYNALMPYPIESEQTSGRGRLAFLHQKVKDDPQVENVLLPLHDGLLVSRRK